MNKENDSDLSYSDDSEDKLKKANNAARIQKAKMFRNEVNYNYLLSVDSNKKSPNKKMNIITFKTRYPIQNNFLYTACESAF